jgi:glycosyltransferase involved in cell wall biosynthesis
MNQRKLTIYQWVSTPACAPYRFIYPGIALNRLEEFDVRLLTQFGQREFDEVSLRADILIVQRLFMSDALGQIISNLNRRGILVAYEIDDNLTNLNPASRYAALAGKDYASQIENCMRACQCVQCSTQTLAASVARIHPEVAVLENQMDHVPPFVERKTDGRSIIVGYAAGSDHGQDWPTIKNAYNRAIADLGRKGIRVETWIIGDKEIFDSVESPHKLFFPVMGREDYLRFLARIDVSIIPLKNDLFNQSKSDVKYLESASAGAPVLASETVYGRTIQNGKNGLVFPEGEDFCVKLQQLITDRPFADRLARAAHRYVREKRLYDLHVSDWSSVYTGWYDRRKELLAMRRA